MKISRLVSIILLLLDKERLSAQALAQTFEVSTRTIYRDVEAINMAGIPISSTPGVGGGFEIMKNYKIDKNVFSTADIATILSGLSSLTKIMYSNELVNTLAKVKSFIPEDSAEAITLKTEQLHIELSQWIGNRHVQPYLEIIKEALQENKLLSFNYVDRHGVETTRKAEAYQLVLKSNHWYFHGYCYTRNDFRLFKLTRISALTLENTVFKPRESQRAVLAFTDILATIQEKIKLRIHKSILDRVLDYGADASLSADGEQHYVVNFPFVDNDYYYNILLSFGNKCECLEPLHVRTVMQRKIAELASIYQD